jgi:hypothetical protein
MNDTDIEKIARYGAALTAIREELQALRKYRKELNDELLYNIIPPQERSKYEKALERADAYIGQKFCTFINIAFGE